MSRAVEAYSDHSLRRIADHEIPNWVERLLVTNAFQAHGFHKKTNNDHVIYRIVRVKKGLYYVGIEVDGELVTAMPVGDSESPYNWFKNRLHNFRVMWRAISNMSIAVDPTRPKEVPKEQGPDPVTLELAERFGVDLG